MSQPINVRDTLTFVPSGYSSAHSSYSGISSSYPVTNGYTDSSSTSYAYITCNTGSRATTYISYTFDVSEIPENATIESITCSAKVRVSSTNYISTATLQLYSGSTAKGSSTSARTTTATSYNLTPGSWTRTELDDIQVRYTGTRGTSNTTRAAYLYFYGATLSVTYSITGTQYTLTAVSEVNNAEITPLAANVMDGESQEFVIQLHDITVEDIKITDNNVDVTSLLELHQSGEGGTFSAVPADDFTTGFSVSGANFYQSSSTTSTSWLEYAIGHSAENPYSTSNTSNTYVKPEGDTGWINYTFDFSSIPINATITNVTVNVYGARENSTIDSDHVARFQCYCGSTAKGSIQNFTSTSNNLVTVTDPGTWTVEELQDAQLRFEIGYYGGRMLGITWTVEYTTPAEDYYTYTLTNMSADHTIVIEQAGAFIPPVEDPEKVYYPITVSSINATTTPEHGTTRVEAGTTETITIEPEDPQLTLALDNGVDITNQLVGGIPSNTYTVTTQVSDASYGFNLNNSTGYYVSTNNGIGSSASVARVHFNLESDVLVTIQYINQGESQADYGMFGKIDTTVSTTGNTYASSSASPDDPDNYYYMCAASADSSTSVKTLTYNITAGEHYIDIKYAKDQASDSGYDSLQWKILSIEATSAGGSYTYTLTNIQEKHSLIFIFGDVNYYFITSTGSNAKLYPDGQLVVLEDHDYHLTIIPDDNSATVTITDNGTDRTSLLEYYEGTDKQGNKVINYVYRLNNVTATHTLNIQCTSAGGPTIYLKINRNWVTCSKVYKKINGSWVEQTNPTDIFNTTKNYVKR